MGYASADGETKIPTSSAKTNFFFTKKSQAIDDQIFEHDYINKTKPLYVSDLKELQ